MKHLGDITKLKGNELPIVDIITGGSPCQDLSVAGKRAGLGGERSGLFMEQIRIVKEMRDESVKKLQMSGATFDIRHIRPRYMVWENVPGAFSSNKGEDFRCVLEEICRIKDKAANVPMPEKGKWSTSGCIMGDGWSVAWRVHNAQFWGVPQRRKRIALVADFGGESAPEILFERKGMSGDITESGKEGEGVASDAGAGIEKTSRAISFQERAGKPGGGKGILIQDGHTGALSTLNNQSVCYPINTMVASRNNNESRTTFGVGDNGEAQFTLSAAHEHAVCYGICSDKSNSMLSGNPHSGIYEADTSRTLDLNGGNPACNQGGMMVVQGADKQETIKENTSYKTYRKQGHPQNSKQGQGWEETNINDTLNIFDNSEGRTPTLVLENHPADSRVKICEDNVFQTLSSRMGTGGGNVPMVMEEPYNANFGFSVGEDKIGTQTASGPGAVRNQSVVRRLTPLECERLQGFPDQWTDIGEWADSKGKKHKDSDSPRYKALGNSIALPFWQWMAERMINELNVEHPTMGSLFDGIGGFPLVYSRCGCEPIWASEIEEFPIAVTKIRFPEAE